MRELRVSHGYAIRVGHDRSRSLVRRRRRGQWCALLCSFVRRQDQDSLAHLSVSTDLVKVSCSTVARRTIQALAAAPAACSCVKYPVSLISPDETMSARLVLGPLHGCPMPSQSSFLSLRCILLSCCTLVWARHRAASKDPPGARTVHASSSLASQLPVPDLVRPPRAGSASTLSLPLDFPGNSRL